METVGKVIPVQLGLISDPPTLVLVYEQEDKQSNGSIQFKRRRRKIPLRQFTDKCNVEKSAQNVILRHGAYMSSIPMIVIMKMLRIMQEIIKGYEPEEAAVKVNAEYELNPNEDLNKLTTDELTLRKMIMEESFAKSLLRPDDPGYKYDHEVAFTEIKGRSGWDEDDDDDDGKEKKGEPINEQETELEVPETIETIHNDDEDDFW